VIGLAIAFGINGALTGRTSEMLNSTREDSGGAVTADLHPVAERLVVYLRIELALLVLIVADMVAKPGA